MEDRLPCGHEPHDHEEYHQLTDLIEHIRGTIVEPRMAVFLTDSGEIHFASSIPVGEAISVLEQTIERLRQHGGNYMRQRADRSRAARWN